MGSIPERLKSRSVGIAGCGGLGSNCAVALARVGMGRLVIADFDVVSAGNLDRQYYFIDQIGQKKVVALKHNIARINPDVMVESHEVKLDPASIFTLFGGCDVIVEAFDLAEMKMMLVETVLARLPEKFIVSASGLAGWGGNDLLKTERYDRLFICGDQRREVSADLPPLAPRVGIVAHMQANLVLEILLGEAPASQEKP